MDKYNTKNPLVKMLMRQFYNTFTDLIIREDIKSMVDIGCGEGHFTHSLKLFFEKNDREVRITALDHDDKYIRYANSIYPDLNVRYGDILDLRGRYDLLISSEVLEHIEDYQKALNNCRKVSPICIFSVPNEPWFRIANFTRMKYIHDLGNTPGHVNNWSKKEFLGILNGHFRKVQVKTSSFWNIAICKESISPN